MLFSAPHVLRHVYKFINICTFVPLQYGNLGVQPEGGVSMGSEGRGGPWDDEWERRQLRLGTPLPPSGVPALEAKRPVISFSGQ